MLKADLYISVLSIRVGDNWLSVLPGAWSREPSLSKFYKKKKLGQTKLLQEPSSVALRSQIEIGSKIQLQLWGEAINYWPGSLSVSPEPWVPPYLNCGGWGRRSSAWQENFLLDIRCNQPPREKIIRQFLQTVRWKLTCSAPGQDEIGVGMPLSAARFDENASVDAGIIMELFYKSAWS